MSPIFSGVRIAHVDANASSNSFNTTTPPHASEAPSSRPLIDPFAAVPTSVPAHCEARKTQLSQQEWSARSSKSLSFEEPTRRVEIQWLDDNNQLQSAHPATPALPIIENAFNAFARGALIPTRHGRIAVEDLMPGDEVETVEGDFETVVWTGAMSLDSRGRDGRKPERLYRIMADTFGMDRPAPDLILGAGARLLLRSEGLKASLGTDQALVPVPSLVDGVSVFEVTPISSVMTYHFALNCHRMIRVNGLDVETYHPGASATGELQGELRERYMALFPHLSCLGDFGALSHSRLSSAMIGDLSPR
ncbi:Hint domain-containing protein [Celeribacter litoreus]|uniref:Hint domain-containing protein n=1 Tax=Celeribacter litoreus TaxID=2876714 RepID=UPI001CC93E01|nr:Hint domain-containing protein [Celeribacter litoreus]MCA0042789.1 Hint domain-containing protein [Celeribacter litoreus]